jgi:hypothetical protein
MRDLVSPLFSYPLSYIKTSNMNSGTSLKIICKTILLTDLLFVNFYYKKPYKIYCKYNYLM